MKNPKQKYFFVHIPKTAGTSFRTMLEAFFPGKQLFPARADRMQKASKGYPAWETYFEIEDEVRDQIQLFAGHIPFTKAITVQPNLKMLTFLRDPKERFISHVNYIHQQRLKNNPKQHLEETYQELRGSIRNIHARYLADVPTDDLIYFKQPRLIDDKALNQAKENLMKCDFFGISEQFTASVLLAEKAFGWRLGRIRRVNKTSSKTYDLPSEITQGIEQATAYDQALYRFACEEFEKRINPHKSHIFIRGLRVV